MTAHPEAEWPELADRVLALVAELAATPVEPGHDPQLCRVCPFCQAILRLRRVNPELADQLTSAAGGIATALRALVRPAVPQGLAGPAAVPPAGPPVGTEREDPGEPPAWPSTVRAPIERIEVTG